MAVGMGSPPPEVGNCCSLRCRREIPAHEDVLRKHTNPRDPSVPGSLAAGTAPHLPAPQGRTFLRIAISRFTCRSIVAGGVPRLSGVVHPRKAPLKRGTP